MAESNPETSASRALRPGHAIGLITGGEALFAALAKGQAFRDADVLE